jgi:multidrug transporter EmrE-like cation transporter
LLFQEQITHMRALAIFLIVAGVALVGWGSA